MKLVFSGNRRVSGPGRAGPAGPGSFCHHRSVVHAEVIHCSWLIFRMDHQVMAPGSPSSSIRALVGQKAMFLHM